MTIAAVLARGRAEHQAGRFALARELYCQILQADPRHADALHLLGVLALQAGDYALAVECIRGAIGREAGNALYHSNLGEAHRLAGRSVEAIACYREALRLRPDLAETQSNLGLALLAVGEKDAAIECLNQALTLNPALPEAHNNLGLARLHRGEPEQAAACFREALRLRPSFAEAENNLANVLRDRGRLTEAITRYRTALRLRPTYPEAANNLGVALMAQGSLDEAIACYCQALRLRPDFAEAHSNFLFALNYLPGVSPDEVHIAHRQWAVCHAPVAEGRPPVNDPDPERPLRVGYVSPDFRNHAVARFVEPLLAYHSRAQVEATCYADVASPDATTARLQSLANGWRSISGWNTTQVVRQVRADRMDLLVDLTGHTGSHRLAVFAQKPAPIQLTYLGYPNTTGLTAIDYRLTENIADPPGAERFYAEKLLRLDGAFCCLAIPPEAPPVTPLPALRNGFVTFGSPHNLAKLNNDVLDLWGQVLRTLPEARLLFFRGELTAEAQERLTTRLAARGVSAERLGMRVLSSATAGYRGYLAMYGEIDIVLDAFPANAGTTACEALAMGVPLITLYGDRFYGRLSASLLTSAGLADWIARTPEEYLTLVRHKTGDLASLARLRAGLRDQVLASPLGNGPALVRSVEAAYRSVWQGWCAAQVRPE